MAVIKQEWNTLSELVDNAENMSIYIRLTETNKKKLQKKEV